MYRSGITRGIALGLVVGLGAATVEAGDQLVHGAPSAPLRLPIVAYDPPTSRHPAPVPMPGADFGVVESTRVSVESPPVAFGEVLVGDPVVVPGAVTVRVVSPRPWLLRLVPVSELERRDGDGPVTLSRLSWRGGLATGFVPFEGREAVVVAEGSPTGSSGRLVILDLKLELTDADPVGEYSSRFRVQMEPR